MDRLLVNNALLAVLNHRVEEDGHFLKCTNGMIHFIPALIFSLIIIILPYIHHFSGLPGTKGTTLTLKQAKPGLTLTSLPTILPYIEIFGPMELGGKAIAR